MNIKIPNLIVSQNITLKSALNKINKNGKKCLIISNKNQKLLGILTDGDVRHAINKDLNLDISIKQIYNNNPLSVIENEYSSSDILNLFHEQKVFVIPVINKNNLLVYITLRCGEFIIKDFIKNKFYLFDSNNEENLLPSIMFS